MSSSIWRRRRTIVHIGVDGRLLEALIRLEGPDIGWWSATALAETRVLVGVHLRRMLTELLSPSSSSSVVRGETVEFTFELSLRPWAYAMLSRRSVPLSAGDGSVSSSMFFLDANVPRKRLELRVRKRVESGRVGYCTETEERKRSLFGGAIDTAENGGDFRRASERKKTKRV